jgi:hypothetical protein
MFNTGGLMSQVTANIDFQFIERRLLYSSLLQRLLVSWIFSCNDDIYRRLFPQANIAGYLWRAPYILAGLPGIVIGLLLIFTVSDPR